MRQAKQDLYLESITKQEKQEIITNMKKARTWEKEKKEKIDQEIRAATIRYKLDQGDIGQSMKNIGQIKQEYTKWQKKQ